MSVFSTLALMVTAGLRPTSKTELDDLRRERDEWRDLAIRYREIASAEIIRAQSLQAAQIFDSFCNCAPARHDLLTRG
jgi:hypothetical protein